MNMAHDFGSHGRLLRLVFDLSLVAQIVVVVIYGSLAFKISPNKLRERLVEHGSRIALSSGCCVQSFLVEAQ